MYVVMVWYFDIRTHTRITVLKINSLCLLNLYNDFLRATVLKMLSTLNLDFSITVILVSTYDTYYVYLNEVRYNSSKYKRTSCIAIMNIIS